MACECTFTVDQWCTNQTYPGAISCKHTGPQMGTPKSPSRLYTHTSVHTSNMKKHPFLSHPIHTSHSYSEVSELQHVCYRKVLLCADPAENHFSSRELRLGLATLARMTQRHEHCQKAHSTFTEKKQKCREPKRRIQDQAKN